jgi:hypothetical protein
LLPLLDREPRNYHALVRLGQAYLAVNRVPEARAGSEAGFRPGSQRAVRAHSVREGSRGARR